MSGSLTGIAAGTLVRFTDGRVEGIRNAMPCQDIYAEGELIHTTLPVDRPYHYSFPEENRRVEEAMKEAVRTGNVVIV